MADVRDSELVVLTIDIWPGSCYIA